MHPLVPFGSYSHQLVQRFDRLVYNQSLDRILGIETTELPGISCQRNALTVHNTIDLEDGDATERRRGLDGRPIFPGEAGVGEIDASGMQRNADGFRSTSPSKYNSSCFVFCLLKGMIYGTLIERTMPVNEPKQDPTFESKKWLFGESSRVPRYTYE